MRIEQLELSGLRSHRGNPPTCLDLSDKRLVAIVGHTGAGKSSLLEAITFALFGEATYGGKAYEELSSDGRSEISVRMVFSVGDDRYQLVRVVSPNRNGIFAAKETWLRRVDGDGNQVSHTDGVRKVDSAVSTLLGGMSREQFCQTVLLAQNRFAALLEADPRQRNDLLDALLGLTALHRAREGLRTVRKSAQGNIERLEVHRRVLPDDPAAESRQARANADAMSDIASRASTSATRLAEFSEMADSLTKEANELERLATMRTTADGLDGMARLAEAAVTLADLSTLNDELQADAKEAENALKAAKKRLAKAESSLEAAQENHGRVGIHEVVAVQLEQLGSLLDEGPALDQERSHAEDVVAKLRGDLEGATSFANDFKEQVDQLRGAERNQREECTTRSTSLARADDAVSVAVTAAERMGTQVDLLDSVVINCTRADESGCEADRKLDLMKDERAAVARVLEEIRRADAAAYAAHDCHIGDACPVCGRSLPEHWMAPEGGDLTAAENALARADEDLAKAMTLNRAATGRRVVALSTLRTSMSSVASMHRDIEKVARDRELGDVPALPPALEALDDGADAVVLLAGVAVAYTLRSDVDGWVGARGDALLPERQELEAAQRRACKAKELLDAAESARGEADIQVNNLNTALAAATSKQEAAVRALGESERRLTTTLQSIDERWRSLIDLAVPRSVLDAGTALATDKEEVDAASEEQTVATAEVNTLEQRAQAIIGDRVRRVEGPRAATGAGLSTLTDLVSALATRLGKKAIAPFDPSVSPKQLLGWAQKLKLTAEGLTEAAISRTTALRLQVSDLITPASKVVTDLVALMNEADPDSTRMGERPDSANPVGPGTRDRVQQIVGAAGRLASEANERATKAKEAVKTAKDLDNRIKALAGWRADLDGAIDVLKKDNFPTWARNARIADLVDASSELLAQMTSGRFRFDPGLRISDELAGIVRKASTLSGGEKFEASLALALGVAEIAGRSGIRFDTLFLDEGFAGLDQAHLNRALDALESEVEAGRCIVLITHIGSVADRIKDVLLIEPDDSGGSSTRWLNEEERFELGADLDLAVP